MNFRDRAGVPEDLADPGSDRSDRGRLDDCEGRPDCDDGGDPGEEEDGDEVDADGGVEGRCACRACIKRLK